MIPAMDPMVRVAQGQTIKSVTKYLDLDQMVSTNSDLDVQV
jgi:hypothetical protein